MLGHRAVLYLGHGGAQIGVRDGWIAAEGVEGHEKAPPM
jgi:hypothetical protein